MELYNGFDSFAEDVQRDVFVRGVDGIALQSEAHQNGFDAENLFEVGDDGDAASTAYGERLPAEGFGKSFFGGFVGRQVDGADVAFATMHGSDFHTDGAWSDALDIVHKQS